MHDVEYKENLRLALISPVKIGAEADIVVYPDNVCALVDLIRFFEEHKIQYKILGRMSNVLPPDEKYKPIVVRTDRITHYEIKDQRIVVGAGMSLCALSAILSKASLSGFEELSGIPGSVGGSIVGNAGAFGREISDVLSALTVFDINDDAVVQLKKPDLQFGYRSSSLRVDNKIVLSAEFNLVQSDFLLIDQRVSRYKNIRKNTQPVAMPSLGSTFKRPSAGLYAAKLIDECGLRGFSIGGAMVSEKHAGFIVNTGAATAKDYIDLSDFVIKTVFEKNKICLEREIEIM